MNPTELLETAITAAIEAGQAIMSIYENSAVDLTLKDDNSPLTNADLASNSIIMGYLKKTGIPIISEENKKIEYSVRRDWKTVWLVDPLDGTKEFIKRNGEFTVNIALVVDGVPTMGVIYVPVSKELFFSENKGEKAFKTVVGPNFKFNKEFLKDQYRITPNVEVKKAIKVVGSRSHMNPETENFVSHLQKEHNEVEIVSKGSSLKFCIVAEGKADIYPRFAPTMEWDTAAGHAICNAAGLTVTSKGTEEELRYNKENLLNNHFIVKK
ncbi:3'(2'),5'-bisphosphate nucleotidase [Flagellimonas allohymeniacidonis]|uniref:3'(2'),5'-bisphosphate nucleotidase CysQ n=1 Tax=Flagellimonas allohymeniacidonis TaxID=2517819 RepID=A0A4Q8QKB5_9FLAO|nr:3'(2'),5'-bisphosphate nucleotidase [Allomuricauda hymeniacidonis]